MDDHVIPTVGPMIVERVHARTLEAAVDGWASWYLPDVYSPGTLNGQLRYLKHFLRWCCDELQVYMPTGRLKPWPEPSDAGRALSIQEVPALLAELK